VISPKSAGDEPARCLLGQISRYRTTPRAGGEKLKIGVGTTSSAGKRPCAGQDCSLIRVG